MTLEEQYHLSCYEELTTLGDHNHIYLVKHKLSGEIFVKKEAYRYQGYGEWSNQHRIY